MIGQSGTLKVTLLWNFQGDIDLHVNNLMGKKYITMKKRMQIQVDSLMLIT